MPFGGSEEAKGLGEIRAGKPANSPAGAKSRRRRLNTATPFFILKSIATPLHLSIGAPGVPGYPPGGHQYSEAFSR
jgi:hypothetical protein